MARPGESDSVAVVIAAYNAEPFLGEALLSVLGQTLRPAEVIVADDCSSDGTAELAMSWSDRLPITVVHTDSNRGPAAARHLAIERSSSASIAVLDADDAWFDDHLEQMVSARRDDNTLVSADPLYWVEGEPPGVAWSQVMPIPDTDQLLGLYRENYLFSGTLFARSLYDRVGGYRQQFRVGEDWDLWIRMLRSGAVAVRLDRQTLMYRVSANSMTVSSHAGPDRVGVLEAAVREAVDEEDRRAARRSLRAVRADRHLLAAYALANSRPWLARLHGLRALSGHRRVAVRGMAMAVAPRRVVGRVEAVRADPHSRFSP